MTFSRPINCHYYNGYLFVLGDVSRQSLYMIDRNKYLEKIPLSSPYHYLFGLNMPITHIAGCLIKIFCFFNNDITLNLYFYQ